MDGAQQTLGMQYRSLYHYPSLQAECPAPGLLDKPDSASKSSNLVGCPPIAYRHVQPSDLDVLREIHEALFPVKYEMDFFLNVVHAKGIVAWAAVDTSRTGGHGDELVGFVTARITKASDAEGDDILGYDIAKADRCLVYILTLGVVKPYRNFGIASALIWLVIDFAKRIPSCRAAYLHVISYNRTAIHFYQKNDFRCLRKLDRFYHIDGRYYDAYLYIYYVNGGRSPCSALYPFGLSLLFKHCDFLDLFASDLLAAAGNFLRNVFAYAMARLHQQSEQKRLLGP